MNYTWKTGTINYRMTVYSCLQTRITVAFAYVNENIVHKKINTSFIRQTLEYASVVGNPHLNKTLQKLRGQREQPHNGGRV